MKFLSLIFIGTSAFAATQTYELSVSPTLNQKGFCVYESKLPFSSFPDYNVFIQAPNSKIWRNGAVQLQTSVEEISSSSYVLNIQATPEVPSGSQPCPVKNFKVLVR